MYLPDLEASGLLPDDFHADPDDVLRLIERLERELKVAGSE